jgi:NADH-quinone oxidoreductase subunit J
MYINLYEYLIIFFGLLSIICSLCIILNKNPIYSILFLILTFCNISFIMILLNVEFIAIIFLIVYVGAISVLFLFVIMMLNLKIIELKENFWKYLPISFLISIFFLFEILIIIYNFNYYKLFNLLIIFNNFYNWFLFFDTTNNLNILGLYLYTYGIYLFFIIGFILLVAIIGSISLVLNQNINYKKQFIYKQLEHNINNSIKIIN